ncbi:hypothetical protein ACW6QP_07975 [Salegentibacter sp. HM20]
MMGTCKKIQASDLKDLVKPDIILCSASFEERSFAFTEEIQDLKFKKAFIFQIIDFDSKIAQNTEKIKDLLKCQNTRIVDLKINDPKRSFLNIYHNISEIFQGEGKNITIDATTFTHECLLMLLRIVKRFKRTEDVVKFYYNGASQYSFNELNNNEKWLTKGVKSTRSIIGYPGYSDPSKKNHLIILFGFEKERSLRLIDEFDYDVISLAYGSREKSITPEHQTLNEQRHDEILSLHSNAKKFNISLVDPIFTKNQILDYVQNLDENIVIAPMNNKLSTIGAGLAAIENPSIQLYYLQPNVYNTKGYSKKGDCFYVWDMR